MNLIVCVDDHDGMAFNGRRLSRDRVVVEKIKSLCDGKRLWISTYSASLFEKTDDLFTDDNFLNKAKKADWCFVENIDLSNCVDRVDSVVVFKWNRNYPSDLKFPMEIYASKWKFVCREELLGCSHDCITMEVYRL